MKNQTLRTYQKFVSHIVLQFRKVGFYVKIQSWASVRRLRELLIHLLCAYRLQSCFSGLKHFTLMIRKPTFLEGLVWPVGA